MFALETVMSVAVETQTSLIAVYFRYTVQRPVVTTQIPKFMFTINCFK